MVEGCGTDVNGMSYWWSNCVHLRLLVDHIFNNSNNRDLKTTLSNGNGNGNRAIDYHRSRSPSPVDDDKWNVKGFIQQIAKLEKFIYDRIQQYLWWKILVPKAITETGKSAKANI